MVISEARWSPVARLVLVLGLALELAIIIASVGSKPGGEKVLPVMLVAAAFAAVVIGLVQTVRVVVEGMDLTVGFAVLRKRIPLRTIDQVAPVRYHWLRWGGWGIRYRPGAVLYNVPGDHGRAVELTLQNGKKVLFSAEDPDAVCAAIRMQRALVPS